MRSLSNIFTNTIGSSSSAKYTPLPTSSGTSTPPLQSHQSHLSDSPFHGSGSSTQSRINKRRIRIIIALSAVLLLSGITYIGYEKYGYGFRSRTKISIHDPAWGMAESEGWVEDESSVDLGREADEAYRLGFEIGEQGSRHYFTRLHDFALKLPLELYETLHSSLYAHLPESHKDLIPPPSSTTPKYYTQSVIEQDTIFQTDKEINDEAVNNAQIWMDLNKGWRVDFFTDEDMQKFVDESFGESEIGWAWDFMTRGVLKADFWRYLIPLVKGGVYTDVDVTPYKSIKQWGTVDVEYLSLELTDGPNWRSTLSASPSIIVGVEVDIHGKLDWHGDRGEGGWPRPLGICQWTFASAPSHPILIEAARRVVNSTKVVKNWEDEKAEKVKILISENKMEEAQRMEELKDVEVMPVMEWTGPGLFSDSVMSYLLARYQVTWHRLRDLDHPLRIGDVMILPITSFSPGGEPDFHSGHHWDTQGAITHGFRGSWKQAGWR